MYDIIKGIEDIDKVRDPYSDVTYIDILCHQDGGFDSGLAPPLTKTTVDLKLSSLQREITLFSS